MKASNHHLRYISEPDPVSNDRQSVPGMQIPKNQYPFHNATELSISNICGRQGCDQILPEHSNGRPARYCSAACRMAAHRQRKRGPIRAEVHFGSATTRSRNEERSWMIKLLRDNEELIVTFGQTRDAAERLTTRLNEFLN